MFTKFTATIILIIFCFTQTSFAAPSAPQNLRGMQDEEANAGVGGQQNTLVRALANAASSITHPVIAAARGSEEPVSAAMAGRTAANAAATAAKDDSLSLEEAISGQIIDLRNYKNDSNMARAAVPLLIYILQESPDENVRRNAAITLGVFGADAADAVKALDASLRDESIPVQRSAEIALERIRAAAASGTAADVTRFNTAFTEAFSDIDIREGQGKAVVIHVASGDEDALDALAFALFAERLSRVTGAPLVLLADDEGVKDILISLGVEKNKIVTVQSKDLFWGAFNAATQRIDSMSEGAITEIDYYSPDFERDGESPFVPEGQTVLISTRSIPEISATIWLARALDKLGVVTEQLDAKFAVWQQARALATGV